VRTAEGHILHDIVELSVLVKMAEKPSGSGRKEKDENSEDLMKKLGMCEDDLNDVVFEDVAPPINEVAARWLAIARVHIETKYSQFWFYKNMQAAWDLAQKVKFQSNWWQCLHIAILLPLWDWEKVMEGGPWAF
jgi:hypothetical protein